MGIMDRQEVKAKGYKPIETKTVFKIKHEQDGSVRYKPVSSHLDTTWYLVFTSTTAFPRL